MTRHIVLSMITGALIFWVLSLFVLRDAHARGPYRGDRARPVRVFKHLRFKSAGRCKVNGEWIKGCS